MRIAQSLCAYVIAFAICSLSTFSIFAQLPSYLPADGLVAWYPFNGNANDESGNGNNGIIGVNSLSVDRYGNQSSALIFNSRPEIMCTEQQLSSPTQFSVSLWLKSTESGRIFGFDEGQCNHIFAQDRYLEILGNGRLRFSVSSNVAPFYLESTLPVNNGQWHHVVYEFSSLGMKLFIDGNLNAVLANNTISIYQGYWRAGGLNNEVSGSIIGQVDDIGVWNRVLSQQEVQSLYAAQVLNCSITVTSTSICSGQSVELSVNGGANTSACASNQLPSNLQNGLVAYYPFCGNANDASGNGNDGVVNGAVLTTNRLGVPNSAYYFNGNSSNIRVSHSASLTFTDNLTVSLWLNAPNYSLNNNQVRNAIGKRRTSSLSGWGIETVDDFQTCCGAQFFINNNTASGGLDYEDPAPMPINQWVHLVGIYDGQLLSLYQNGQLLGTATGMQNLSSTLQDMFIGSEYSNGSYFLGAIDDIFIWNRAISPAEVQALYSANEAVSVLWSTGATTPSITVAPTETTTYSVTVTQDGQTCNSDVTITVNQPSASSIEATITEGETYDFNGQSLAVAGTYEAVLENAVGCDSVVTLTLTVNPALTCDINASATSICAGESVELSVNGGANASACASNQLPANLQNGLVAYYPFCGNANDASGNGNDGLVNGASLTSNRFGSENTAFSFNRSGIQSVQIESSPILEAIQNVTVGTWVYLNSYGAPGESGYNHFVNKSIGSGNYQFVFANNLTGLYFYFDDGVSFIQSQSLPSLSAWHHIAVSYNYDGVPDNSVCKFYIDGICVGTYPSTKVLDATDYPIFLGSYLDGAINTVDGKMDDVTIWNRALTEAEILSLYMSSNQEYSWSNGATTPSITVAPTETTTYSVTVTQDGQTCTSDVTITVNQPSAEAIEATITEGETYEFNGQSLTTAGTYEAVLVNTAGCDSVVTLTLTVNPALTCEITASAMSICGSALTCASNELPANLQNGLIAFYPFCGNAQDASGNGNDGLVNGAVLSSDRFGNAASAYYFNGVNSRIDLSSINEAGDFSISYWEKINETKFSYPVGLGVNTTNFYNGYGIGQSGYTGECAIPANIHFVFDGLTECTNLMYSSAESVSQEWRLVSFTYEQGNSKLYYNGNLVSESTELDYPGFFMLTLGIRSDGAWPFGGWIDDVLVHNRALEMSEIQSLLSDSGVELEIALSENDPLASACTSSQLPTNLQNGLIAYYPFCGNANDASGNGNDGQVSGALLSSDRFGSAASAYYFNGANARIDISNINETGDFSITYWEKINQVKFAYPVGLGVNTTNFYNGYGIGQSGYTGECAIPANIHFVFDGLTECTNLMFASDQSVAQQWRLVSFTHEQGNSKLYYNGNLVSESSELDYPGFFLLTLGVRSDSAFPFDGWIDDVLVHNRALSAAEIQSLNGGPIAQVLWSNGATTPSITVSPTETTTYSVTVTQDGQTCTSDVTIEVLPTETFYADNDGDGFGDAGNSINACEGQPQGYVTDNSDCDDTNAAVFIGASCDDGDACTEGDILRGDCTCAGTYSDDDQDGTCNALDLCAFGPEPGTACDDNNPCTMGDSIQDDCTCAGQAVEQETSIETAHACEPFNWNGEVYTQSGTYTYITTNALGCDSIATLELTVGAPSSSSTAINACNGYTWNEQAYTQSGTYTFVTPNTSGCDSTATLVLTIQNPSVAPTAINASSASVTVGGSVTLSVVGGTLGSGAQWKWYSQSCGGQFIGTGNSITVTVNATNAYFVRAEGDCNVTSCASVTITANPIPCGPQSVAASALSVCYGSSTMLTVSGQLNAGASWKWYKNACGSGVVVGTGSSLAVLPTATTTYFVRAEGGTCGITSCQSITITVNPAPAQPAFIQGPVNGLCGLQGVSYSTPAVSGASSYVWSVPTGATIVSGQGTNAIVVNYGSSLGINTVCGATSICVRSVNACGSSALRCVNLSLAPATPGAITGQSIVCRTQSYTYSIAPVAGATSYTWTVPSTWQITSGQGTTSITVVAGTMNGEVRVLANNACGASKIARRSVTTFVCSNPGMTMLDEMPELALWPNPANDLVHLDVDQIIPDKVEIYDMLGKRMYEGAWTQEFDVTTWPSGMYIVRVTLGEEHLIQRLEIAH